MRPEDLEERLEGFVRSSFRVAADDPGFDREVDLFERGYVDSVGFVEMLEFIREETGIEVPEQELMSDEFTTIAGISRVLCRLSPG